MNVAAGEVQISRSLDLHWCINVFPLRYPWKTRLTSTSKVGPKSICLSATTIHVAVTQTFPETKQHIKYFTKTHLPQRWGHSFGLPQAPAQWNLLWCNVHVSLPCNTLHKQLFQAHCLLRKTETFVSTINLPENWAMSQIYVTIPSFGKSLTSAPTRCWEDGA